MNPVSGRMKTALVAGTFPGSPLNITMKLHSLI